MRTIARVTGLFVFVLAAARAYATVYTVGDSSGWTTNVNYNNWLNGKTFYVGDSLYFYYTMLHNVNEVDRNDFYSCSTGNYFQSYTDGSTTIALNTPGTRYFVCGTSGHCAGGMKLAVTTYSGNGNYKPNGNNYYNPSEKNVVNGVIVGASALVALSLIG